MNQRIQILPGVYLRVVSAQKFKTACFSVNFLQQLTPQTAPLNALLPSVLLRGTKFHPDIQQISEHLDELYGASFGTLVRKRGDVVTCGFYADFVEDRFVPDGTELFRAMTRFLHEVLFEPLLDGNGLFLQEFVEGEKRNLIHAIEANLNDKRAYAVTQLISHMCQDDPYGIPRLGNVDQAQKITPQTLMAFYRQILQSSQIEIFYMGSLPQQTVCQAMCEALSALPKVRSICTVDVKLLVRDLPVRRVEQSLEVTQGKLCLGFRTNCGGTREDYPALQLLNAIFGGCVTSKLFLHVREELSLCYYASSMLERAKGIMIVSSGIDFDQAQTAQAEILRQLDACREEQISEEEIETARRFLLSAWRASLDAPGRIDEFYLGQTICADSATIEDWIAALQRVTKPELVSAARKIMLDTVYLLKGRTAAC